MGGCSGKEVGRGQPSIASTPGCGAGALRGGRRGKQPPARQRKALTEKSREERGSRHGEGGGLWAAAWKWGHLRIPSLPPRPPPGWAAKGARGRGGHRGPGRAARSAPKQSPFDVIWVIYLYICPAGISAIAGGKWSEEEFGGEEVRASFQP